MNLSGRARFGFSGEPFLALLGHKAGQGAFTVRKTSDPARAGVTLRGSTDEPTSSDGDIRLPRELGYLSDGDIVRLNPTSGELRVLYRRGSRHNTLFFTERCNSRCLMCSQPPREIDDRYLVDEILQMLPWMAADTPELGITGGEPTLHHGKLLEVIASAKRYLPATALHMLSNGRLLAYTTYARQLAAIEHPDFMVGIPLYSDTAGIHDFVVQAEGAFEQTVAGILNLARVGLRIELRMVVHRETYLRLPEFGRFVARNLPFVAQVVIMGLEPTGFARSNIKALWIDPADYQDQLEQCVRNLDDAGVNVAIYNHPLCVVRDSIRSFTKKSISDWKNIYLPECEPCVRKDECGGFFASAALRHSAQIRPFAKDTD